MDVVDSHDAHRLRMERGRKNRSSNNNMRRCCAIRRFVLMLFLQTTRCASSFQHNYYPCPACAHTQATNANAGNASGRSRTAMMMASAIPPLSAAVLERLGTFQDKQPESYIGDFHSHQVDPIIFSHEEQLITQPPQQRAPIIETPSRFFGMLHERMAQLLSIDIGTNGVSFALSYSALSQINGSITLSIAWYLSSMRSGLSPLAPGQWKSLLTAYGTIYAGIQLLKPLRVAAAITMSKQCKQFLEGTQERLNCSRGTAIAFQYSLGWIVWFLLASAGIALASIFSGVGMLPPH